METCFAFHGRESLDSLSLWQLDVLRNHGWKRRAAQEMAEGEEFNNAQNAIDSKKGKFDVEKVDAKRKAAKEAAAKETPDDAEGDGKKEPFYRVTRKHTDILIEVQEQVRQICHDHFPEDLALVHEADELVDEEESIAEGLVPFTLKIKSLLQQKLLGVADTNHDGYCDFEEFSEMKWNNGMSTERLRTIWEHLDVNKDGRLSIAELRTYMEEICVHEASEAAHCIEQERKQLPKAMAAALYDFASGGEPLSIAVDNSDIYLSVVQIERIINRLKGVLQEQVIDIAFKMQKGEPDRAV